MYDKEKKWCALKGYNEEKITIKDYKEEECKVEEKPVTTSEACFDFDASTKTITKFYFGLSGCGTDVVIPNTIGGVVVEHIGDNSFNGENINVNQKLTSVIFPSELVSIGNDAFYLNHLFSKDTSLNLEKLMKLKTIGDYAFSSGMGSAYSPAVVSLPSNIETVGTYAFGYNCVERGPFTIQYKLGSMNLEEFKALLDKAIYTSDKSITSGGYHINKESYQNSPPC